MKTRKYCIYVLLICLFVSKVELKQLYGVKSDDLVKEVLQDVYLGKLGRFLNLPENSVSNSTPPITAVFYTTKKMERRRNTRKVNNMTVDKFLLRRRRMKVKELLEENINTKLNFGNKVDEFTIQSRRFNSIIKSNPEDTEDHNALREEYFDHEDRVAILRSKNKITSLMEQFIYETHYMLPFMQLMRNKYKTHRRYQMGYCFALLRALKLQQMILYSNIKTYEVQYLSIYTHVKVYEKIVRLDIDIKDLIAFMYKLDSEIKKRPRRRSTTYNPNRNSIP